MSNILEQRPLKIFVRILQQHNVVISFITLLTLLYSVNYPLFFIISIYLIVKYYHHIYLKTILLIYVFFILFLLFYSSYQEPFHLVGKEVTIVSKNQQTYTHQYIVRDQFAQYIFYSNQELNIGSILVIDGKVSSYNVNTIPKGFHPKHYYLSKGIIGQLSNVTIVEIHERRTLANWIYNLKEKYHGTELEPYIQAFIFDDQKEIRMLTFEWLFYLFSISGLHLYVLSQGFIYIFKVKQFKHQLVLRMCLVFPFLILQPFHFTVMRLMMMYGLMLVFSMMRFQVPKYVILLLIWCLIVIFQPYKIYDIGMFISFFLIFNIYLIQHQKSHPLLSQYHIIVLASSIIYLYNGRLMFLPMILMPLIIILVVYTMFLPTLSIFLLQLNISFLKTWFDKLNGLFSIINTYNLTIQSPIPSHHLVSIGLILICIIQLTATKVQALKKILVLMLGFFVIGEIFVSVQIPSLIFLDVGQGDATVYIDKDCVVVVDAFSNVESYLRSHGHDYIDYLFLTHSDLDHIKEANTLIKNMKVHHVITSPYQNIEGIETKTIYQFPKTYVCGELTIDILGPTYSMFDDNDDSLILLLEFNETKILFTGDASKAREKQILSSIHVDIDVLKIGHHGSNTSTAPELLYTIKPKFGIISASKNNRYGMPHEDVIKSLNDFNVIYFMTSRDGSIKMTIVEGDILWETYPP